MIHRLIIGLNNRLGALRPKRVAGDNVLMLAPRCLQHAECSRDVVSDIENCAACGRCRVGDLLTLRREFGLRVVVANGGRQAAAAARDESVRVVIAVACEKELAAGIMALRATRRVYAIPNIVRCRPCIHTDVKISDVRAAIERVVCHAE